MDKRKKEVVSMDQKKKVSSDDSSKPDKEKKRMPADYWERVAEDIASGYGADDIKKENPTNILNVDQQPDDHERGDA